MTYICLIVAKIGRLGDMDL